MNTIYEDDEFLSLRRHYMRLQTIARAGEDVNWSREGRVRVVPNAALKNALSLFRDHCLLVRSGRLRDTIPRGAIYIVWDDATPRAI